MSATLWIIGAFLGGLAAGGGLTFVMRGRWVLALTGLTLVASVLFTRANQDPQGWLWLIWIFLAVPATVGAGLGIALAGLMQTWGDSE